MQEELPPLKLAPGLTGPVLTLGRIVRYKVKNSDPGVLLSCGVGTELPAIITKVQDRSVGIVNLQVFSDHHGGSIEWLENVPKGEGNGNWSWPPKEAA